MNVTNGALLVRRQQIRAEGAGLVEMTAPIANLKIVLSVREAFANAKLIQERKALNEASDNIIHASRTLLRRHRELKARESDEESSMYRLMKKAIWSGVKTFGKMFVRVIGRVAMTILRTAFRYIVAPAFRILGGVLLRTLPLVLTNPVVLTVLGVGAVGYGVYELYKRFKNADKAKRDLESTKPSTAVVTQQAPAQTAPEVTLPKSDLPRGIRNNNPGNLNFANQPGATKEAGPGGRFAVFQTQGAGLYNLARQISLYHSRGINTIQKVIEKFAPPNENNTKSYIQFVSKKTGIGKDDVFQLNTDNVFAIMRAIIKLENGMDPYSDAQLNEAITQALSGEKTIQTGPTFAMPVQGRVSSGFGARNTGIKGASTDHKGVDIAAPQGTDVRASQAGTVTRAELVKTAKGDIDGYGNMVEIKSPSYYTRYAHLASYSVRPGDKVEQGQVIGKVGNTGIGSGAHLHFEIHPVSAGAPSRANAVDPASYLGLAGKGTQTAAAGTIIAPSQNTDFIRDSRDRLVRLS